MEENININKELEHKNQEMLLNKKKIDLEKSMESVHVFYSNYSSNLASEINNQICMFRNVDPNSEQGKIFYNTITSFFFITSKKLKEIITNNVELVKSKLDNISDNDYNNVLNHLSLVINNQMMDYYSENASMLSNELNQDIDEETKIKINKYIFEVLTIKIMNVLRDKFMFAIKVINNNYDENKEVMDKINEKTIKGV